MRIALDYASKGWTAAVTVSDGVVRVVAIPENGIEPKQYVLGLLQHRYLDDALPLLKAPTHQSTGAERDLELVKQPATAVPGSSTAINTSGRFL